MSGGEGRFLYWRAKPWEGNVQFEAIRYHNYKLLVITNCRCVRGCGLFYSYLFYGIMIQLITTSVTTPTINKPSLVWNKLSLELRDISGVGVSNTVDGSGPNPKEVWSQLLLSGREGYVTSSNVPDSSSVGSVNNNN